MKKTFAMAVTIAMIMCMTSGCYDEYKLKKFDIEVGDEITLGKYQNEEIEWDVLSRHFYPDEGKVTIELQSKYALDCQPFNEDGPSSWDESSLREWLNNDFFEEAFSSKEQKHIVDTTYYNYVGDSRYLTDKVYIMGLLWYHMRADDAVCEPTDYAEDKGIDMEDGRCRVWGRDVLSAAMANTSGESGTHEFAVAFTYDGNVGSAWDGKGKDDSFTAEDIGVRPVINVEYKAPYTTRDLNPGDLVTFGTYDEAPIEWIVTDREKSEVTLFSRYGLDDMRMDKDSDTEFKDSELYEWLNDDFVSDAFNKKEQKQLVAFDSDDLVTFLSLDDIRDMAREAKPELYATYSPAYFESQEENDDNVFDSYWLSDFKPNSEDGKTHRFFQIKTLGGKCTADEEHSIRPVIKVAF